VNNFRNNIVFLRNKANITQDEMAERMCLSRSSIAAYEGRGVEPSLDNLVKYAEILEVTIDDLLKTETWATK
jgi:transcriptional regulator with XRE-family HTH domain